MAKICITIATENSFGYLVRREIKEGISMSKFDFGLGVVIGFAGVIIYKRYKAARDAAREIHMYEDLDAGYFEEESR